MIPYLDDFDPSSVCEPYRSMVATHVVPPILASLDREDEFVICQLAAASEKLGNVHIAVMAGGHVRKDFRKTIAYDGLWRLTRILAFVSWRCTYCLSLMEPGVAMKMGFKLHEHQAGSSRICFGRGNDLHPYLLHLSDRALRKPKIR